MFIESRIIDTDATHVFVLGTSTGLETQVDVLISMKKPASSR
jgi:hypothetical protein